PERTLHQLEERGLVVLAVEARGEPDGIAGIEAHVLGHALGEGVARHVPRELEERDALLRGDARAATHVAVDEGPDLRVLEIGLARRVEEPARGPRLHDLHEAAVDLSG